MKFVILSQSRVGSSLLNKALRSDSLTVESELLVATPCRARDYAVRFMAPFAKFGNDSDPVHVLNAAFATCDGLKVHLRDLTPATAAYLRNMPDLKLVCLRRRNQLLQALSFALGTRQLAAHAEPQRREPIRLEPAEIICQIRRWRDEAEFYAGLFAHIPSCSVEYEELTMKFDATVARVQEFLEVEPTQTAPAYRKIGVEPFAEIVTNAAEVLEAIRRTEFAWMADDVGG